jgi:putative transposase
LYLLTAASYEHRPVIGFTPERVGAFESDLLKTLSHSTSAIFAWNLLPNHYHVLVDTRDIEGVLRLLGRLHGRTSFRWNGEEDLHKGKVWHRAAETVMKSDRHFWAAFNSVLHNAVRHGYVDHWQDWPYSNAAEYLTAVGREEAERRWREFPVLDYGKDWDPRDL